MPRTFLIAANWKMNPIPEGSLNPDSSFRPQGDVDVAVFPTFLDIHTCVTAGLPTGAQYGHPEATGAHTGDVSMQMIRSLDCAFVLCGHSERRQGHSEKDQDVAAQVEAALRVGLHPIVCVGETKSERETKRHKHIVERQIKALPLHHQSFTIAYEPVWAIGTGLTATAAQAEDMHAFIRSLLPAERQSATRILYGGSLKPENAVELLQQPNIDGGLVGGASLNPKAFAAIVASASSIHKS